MKVYKYCHPDYNPLNGCRTIRLGSTKEFRSKYAGEGDFINDNEEGLATGIDRNRNRFERFKNHPDSYVFCTSLVKHSQKYVSENFVAGYDSCYCIRDIELFRLALISLIPQRLKLSMFPNHQVQPVIISEMSANNLSFLSFCSQLKILSNGHEVVYRKGDFIKVNNFLNKETAIFLSNFTKPPKYKNQFEHRLAFTIYFPMRGLYFDVTDEPLYLKFDNILDYVEPC